MPPDALFFVKHKGWCSLRPSLAAARYQLSSFLCLVPGDVCEPVLTPEEVTLPPGVALSISPDPLALREFGLFPGSLGSTLRVQQERSISVSARVKRPMNSFMLFAKRYRLELTRLHPGKDNRDISVLLGERWRGLLPEEKRMYAREAQLLADIHKQSHPDCWKRKKTKFG